MVLIPCDTDCKHQNEGYCCLDRTSPVTNAKGGCAFYEKKAIRPISSPESHKTAMDVQKGFDAKSQRSL